MRQQRWAVGVDFGGTNIKCGLVDTRGRVRRSLVLSSKRFGRPAAFVDRVVSTVQELARAVGVPVHRLRGVGVGAPGLVDVRRGIVHWLVNVPGWRNVPLARRLSARLGVPVFVDNDVNLVALGEWRWGAGRKATALVCLTLGTGLGGGLVFDGTLYRGASGAAGELGHISIDPHGPRCACGARGCLEAHVGSAAIIRLARGAAHGSRSPLGLLAAQARGRLTPELVARAARMGDAAAREVWVEVGRLLGQGLSGIVNLLNPDRIVIGGGVANAWTLFAPSLRRTIRAHAMDIPGRDARVVRAQLGNQAGIIGAAVLVWDKTR
jgi:glucokinase